MRSFKTITMKDAEGREYQIDLSLNDAAIMDNNLEIEVVGRYRHNHIEQWNEEVFTVRLVPANRLINVIYHNEIIGTISLINLDEGLNEVFDELDGPSAWNALHEFFLENGGEFIGDVIQRIPAFDPVFGCLLKSGLSTAIGQLIECHSKTRAMEIELLRQKVLAMLRCLGVNSFAMAGKFTFRALRCAAMGGWDVI